MTQKIAYIKCIKQNITISEITAAISNIYIYTLFLTASVANNIKVKAS